MTCGHCGVEMEPIPGVGWVCLPEMENEQDPVVGTITLRLRTSGKIDGDFSGMTSHLVLKTLGRTFNEIKRNLIAISRESAKHN